MSEPSAEREQITDLDDSGREIASPRWSAGENDRLRDLYDRGSTDAEIALELRRSVAAIRCQRHRLRICTTRPSSLRRANKRTAALAEIVSLCRRRPSADLLEEIAETARGAL